MGKRHYVVIQGTQLPSGYVATVGSMSVSVTVSTSAVSIVEPIVIDTEKLHERSTTSGENEVYHTYLEGTLALKLSPTNDSIHGYVHRKPCFTIAKYSSNYYLAYEPEKNIGYLVVKPVSGRNWTPRYEIVFQQSKSWPYSGDIYYGTNHNTLSTRATVQDARYSGKTGKHMYTINGEVELNDNIASYSFTYSNSGRTYKRGNITAEFIGDITAITCTCRVPTQYEWLVGQVFGELNKGCLLPDQSVYQQLVVDMLSELQYVDINMIAFTSDFIKFKELVTSVSNALKGKVDLKKVTSLHLMKKYCVDTTIRDIDELITVVPKVRDNIIRLKNINKPLRYHDHYTEIVDASTPLVRSVAEVSPATDYYTTTVKMFRKLLPNDMSDIDKFINLLDNFDALPTWENLWDLVPYSFVIDWFLNLGSITTALNAYRQATKYTLRALICSRKRSCSLFFNRDFSGCLNYECYDRSVMGYWPGWAYRLSFDLPTSHFLEAGCLIIQKL